MKFDHRLILRSTPGCAFGVLNLPRKAFDFSEIAPRSLVDNTGTVANLAALQDNYLLWVDGMRQSYSGTRLNILCDVCAGVTTTHAKSIAVFPVRWVQGGNWDSFMMVFVPAFAPIQENANNLDCSWGSYSLETRSNKLEEEISMRCSWDMCLL